jgi:hypothetical protein
MSKNVHPAVLAYADDSITDDCIAVAAARRCSRR